MYFATLLLKNLVRRRARSLLTILGIAVAIGTVVTLRGVSYGFERSFRANFEGRGIDLVVVAAGIPDQLRSDLDEDIGPRIEQIEGVRRVSSGLLELVDIERGDSVISILVNGWRPGGAQLDDLAIVSGRAIRPEDSRAIMLGVTLAENLHKGVGDTVTMQGERFEVVGVYRSFDLFENGGAVVPLATLQHLMVRPRSVTGFTVELEPTQDKEALADAVRRRIEALADDQGKPYGITAQPTRDYVSGTDLHPHGQRHGLDHLGHRPDRRQHQYPQHDDHGRDGADQRDRPLAGGGLGAGPGTGHGPGRGIVAEPDGSRCRHRGGDAGHQVARRSAPDQRVRQRRALPGRDRRGTGPDAPDVPDRRGRAGLSRRRPATDGGPPP